MDRHVLKFLDYVSVEKNYSRHTRAGYAHDLDEFFTFAAGRPVMEMDLFFFRRYLAELKKKEPAKTTVARKLAALRSFFRFLAREGHIKKNPAAGLRGPKLDKKLPFFLNEGDVGRLLAFPFEELADYRDRALLETIYSTGCRVFEIVGLDVE